MEVGDEMTFLELFSLNMRLQPSASPSFLRTCRQNPDHFLSRTKTLTFGYTCTLWQIWERPEHFKCLKNHCFPCMWLRHCTLLNVKVCQPWNSQGWSEKNQKVYCFSTKNITLPPACFDFKNMLEQHILKIFLKHPWWETMVNDYSSLYQTSSFKLLASLTFD